MKLVTDAAGTVVGPRRERSVRPSYPSRVDRSREDSIARLLTEDTVNRRVRGLLGGNTSATHHCGSGGTFFDRYKQALKAWSGNRQDVGYTRTAQGQETDLLEKGVLIHREA